MAGRPIKLTPDLADDLVLLLSAGASLARAARALGVGERTIRRCLRNCLRERVGLARASGQVGTDALAEAHLVVLIARAAAHDWKAGAWLLARRYPQRWGADPGEAPSRTVKREKVKQLGCSMAFRGAGQKTSLSLRGFGCPGSISGRPWHSELRAHS